MNARSLDELVDQITRSSKFRKRELITLKQFVYSRRDHESLVARRSALALSYAHWEGFIKDTSHAYVSYVSFLSPPLCELTINFQALACKTILCSAARANKRIAPHLTVISGLIDVLPRPVNIDPKFAIDTESILDSDVFENICLSVGVDYNSFWKSHSPLIEDIFKIRCSIVHGKQYVPDKKFAIEAIEFVLMAINLFYDQIINLASEKKYLKNVG